MKILYRSIHVFLYLDLVAPTLMYYIYDDSPSSGYMAVENGIGTYARNEYGKKYYTGSYNVKQKKYNDRMIDSHFNVRKMPITRFQSTPDDSNVINQDFQAITEPPKQTRNPKLGRPGSMQQQNIKMKTHTRSEYTKNKQDPVKKIPVQQVKSKPLQPEYVPIKPVHQINADQYEPKANVVQVNVRKTQVSTDPQKLRLSNTRTSSLLQYAVENHKRIPVSIIPDAKKSMFNERNSQIMTRVLNEMTQKVSDRRQRKGETRKRDTEQTEFTEMYTKAKRNTVTDNMVKYIGKDKTIVKQHHKRTEPVVDSRATDVQHDTPYALFYRMNPENMDQQAGFMLMGSAEEHPDDLNSEKHLPSTVDGQADYKNANSKKTTNTLKLHKRMKNFSSYPNF